VCGWGAEAVRKKEDKGVTDEKKALSIISPRRRGAASSPFRRRRREQSRKGPKKVKRLRRCCWCSRACSPAEEASSFFVFFGFGRGRVDVGGDREWMNKKKAKKSTCSLSEFDIHFPTEASVPALPSIRAFHAIVPFKRVRRKSLAWRGTGR